MSAVVIGVRAVRKIARPSADLERSGTALVPAVFLRITSVMQMTGLGRSTIYRLMAQQQFPSPVCLGVRAVAWLRSELDLLSQTRRATSH
ncbi:MAG: transcriptional regulator [Burkholderiales bacterium]|nr:MAG: transcriptional regulator [Burkholderiales bacterium]